MDQPRSKSVFTDKTLQVPKLIIVPSSTDKDASRPQIEVSESYDNFRNRPDHPSPFASARENKPDQNRLSHEIMDQFHNLKKINSSFKLDRRSPASAKAGMLSQPSN